MVLKIRPANSTGIKHQSGPIINKNRKLRKKQEKLKPRVQLAKLRNRTIKLVIVTEDEEGKKKL